MHFKNTCKGESDETTVMKPLTDPYVKENRKNNTQEAEGTLGMREEAKRWPVLGGSKRVKLGVVVIILALASVGAGVAVASASHILHHMGFTSKGVAKQSFASRLQSSTSRANNHTVPKDSWVSWLQKAGQKGVTAEHQAYFATGGAIAGVVVAVTVVLVAVVVTYTLRRCRNQSS